MKQSILITFIIIIIQLLVQYSDLHHYNAYLDRLLWDTSEFFVSLLILLILIFIAQRIKKPILKYLFLLVPVFIGIVCLLMFTKGCTLVSESYHDYTQKMYFHSDGGWNYYARTWRRGPLDDLDVFIRKEKDFGIGFYLDKKVNTEELHDLGFDEFTIEGKYQQYYPGKKN